MRKINNQSPRFIIITALIAILSGCGSSGVTEKDAPPMSQTDTQTPVPIPGLIGGYAPFNDYFETCGKEPSAVSGLVQTDNVLNIRVRAESAPQNGCYPNPSTSIPYQARYSCVRFKVIMQVKTGPNAHHPANSSGDQWIDQATFLTDPLKAPGTEGCAGSKDEVVYNLSNRLFPGHGLVRFKIESVDTDHMCNLYKSCQQNPWQYDCAWVRGLSAQSVCPLKPVYQYHKTAGQIDVQTDVTVL